MEKELTDIVKKYRPDAVKDWDKFDKSRANDSTYCIEWGMKKAQNHECIIFEKMIKELESFTQPQTNNNQPKGV